MKKLIINLIAFLLTGQAFAQLVNSNGAKITVNGAFVQVNGSLLNDGGILDIKQISQVVVKGNIDNQGKLSNDGHIDLFGNLWSTTKIDNPDFGVWSFSGSSIQSITSDSAIVAKNMFFSNPAGFLADVQKDLKVTNTANFVSGILKTLNATRMTFGSAASHTGSSDASHVQGLVAKEGTGVFTYPVGTSTKLQSIAINASTNPTDIQVAYNVADAGAAMYGITGAQVTPLKSYNTSEYWQMTSGGAQGTVEMTHDAFNALTFGDLADVRVGRKVGAEWLNQGGIATGTLSNANITSLSSTLDGSFTLGIIKKDISISIHNPSGKTSICFKDTLTINIRRVLGLNEYPTTTSFSISPASAAVKVNDTTFKLFPSTSTLYTVTGIDQNNLQGIVTFNLTVNQLPNVTAAIQNPIVVNGVPLNLWPQNQTISLGASGANTYSWTPNTFVIAGSNSSLLTSSPANHITYTVLGTDVNGCKNTASVPIRAFTVVTASTSSCSGIVWRGKTITNTGFYGDTVTASLVDTVFGLNFTSNAVNVGIVIENGKLASQCMNCQYQWYACKPDGTLTLIENAKSRILSITTRGTYLVEASNGICNAKSPCTFYDPTSSSIAGADEFKGISVFPNPFVDNLIVQLSEKPVNALIQIVDINGRVVNSKNVNKATETIMNLSALSQGTYYIQIVFEKEGGKLYYTKIVKE